MLLTVNIGNSSIRFGVFDKQECRCSWIIDSKTGYTQEQYFDLFETNYAKYLIERDKIENVVIGSVVPDHTRFVCSVLEKIHDISPFLITNQTPSCIKHTSPELGTDLYANAVAAYIRFKKTCIIIDFGTALTFTCVSKSGKLLGVVIAPGINAALKSLVNDTAQLPDIELSLPSKILGKDTVSCMQSGMIYGYLSMIEGIIDRINEQTGVQSCVIATGGLCHVFESLTDKIHYTDKLHTVRGLKLIYEQSKQQKNCH